MRGSIVDVFPSTADAPGAHRPVGRRGRPAHRVLGDRPALDGRPRPRSRSSRAASCCPPTRCASRAERAGRRRAVGPRAVGAAGRGPDVRRHGVVAAVAHRGRARAARPARPRRPGAAGRAPPHARPGRRPPRRGGRPRADPRPDVGRVATRRPSDGGFPRLHLPFDRLLAHTDAPAWTVTTAPEGPRRRHGRGHGLGPGGRRRRRASSRQLRDLLADGYRVVVAADDGAGSAERLASSARSATSTALDRRRSSSAPLERGLHPAGVKLAVLAESRRHRPAPRPPRGRGPRRRDAQRLLRRPARPATTSCTTSTASPATAAW